MTETVGVARRAAHPQRRPTPRCYRISTARSTAIPTSSPVPMAGAFSPHATWHASAVSGTNCASNPNRWTVPSASTFTATPGPTSTSPAPHRVLTVNSESIVEVESVAQRCYTRGAARAPWEAARPRGTRRGRRRWSSPLIWRRPKSPTRCANTRQPSFSAGRPLIDVLRDPRGAASTPTSPIAPVPPGCPRG